MRWLIILFPCSLLAFEVSRDLAEVHLAPVAISSAVPVLESLLGKRIVLDGRAAGVPVSVATANQLQVSEQKEFAMLNLKAAGLACIDTPTAIYICNRTDVKDCQRFIADRLSDDPEISKTVELRFAVVADVMLVLTSQFRREAGAAAYRPALPLPARSDGSELGGQPFAQGRGSLQAQAPSYNLRDTIGASDEQGAGPLPTTVKTDEIFIIADPSSRRIHLSGDAQAVEQAMQTITALDLRQDQIMISAVIAEFDAGRSNSFSVEYAQKFFPAGSQWVLGGRQSSGEQLSPARSPSLPDARASDSGLSVFGYHAAGLGVLIKALESNDKFHVLQRPSVSTLNAKPARIWTGQQVPIQSSTLTQSGSGSGVASIAGTTQFVPVRLQIDITPHVMGADQLRLDFSQTNAGISGYSIIGGSSVPTISEQGLRNTVIVQSGSVVLLGGMVSQVQRNDRAGIPILSRIPVVGRLFGSSRKDKGSKEILVFLEARILPVQSDAETDAAQARDFSRRF